MVGNPPSTSMHRDPFSLDGRRGREQRAQSELPALLLYDLELVVLQNEAGMVTLLGQPPDLAQRIA